MLESLTFSELIVPGVIVFGAGLIFLILVVIASVQWIKVARARRWPTAGGTVLESRVAASRGSKGAWYYRAVIVYQYAVGVQIFTNDLLAFGSRSLREGGAAAEKRAQETVARYPAGSTVGVHYHPERPAQSVLEIRSLLAKWLVLFGVIFLFAGMIAAGVVLIVNAAS